MKKNTKKLLKIIISAVLATVFYFVPFPNDWIKLIAFIAVYLLVGGDVLKKAGRNILHGQVFDENFLMSIATIGAFFLGEYIEAVAVMLFYQIGEYFQSYAVNKSRNSISELMDIRPDYANLEMDGDISQVDPEEVEIGNCVIVKPGEKVPLDGIVIQGSTTLDTSALTGESIPREVVEGDEILSGTININGVIRVEVTKEFVDSTVSKILDLVENASAKKSKSENFITRFARYYTPVVVILAVFLAIVPPLLISDQSFETWTFRALSFLIISCPCALVVSVPLSFFGGIGGASQQGILIKGSNYLEALSKTRVVVFDKTGTLTKGVFKVQKIVASEISEDELLEITAHLESYSNHPISLSLQEAYSKDIRKEKVSDIEEISGYGIKGKVDGKVTLVGNAKLMKKMKIDFEEINEAGTIIHVAIDDVYAGYIVIADEIKQDAADTIRLLKKAGVSRTVMLTGDRQATGELVAKEVGIDEVYTELLPGDKVTHVERILQEKLSNQQLAFVGDGINDAPVLARADIGIAMGGLGSDAAIEAADVVIMTDELSKISTAMNISGKTIMIVRENIFLALATKFTFLLLSALGFTSIGMAIFADVGITLIAVFNSMRCLNTKEFR